MLFYFQPKLFTTYILVESIYMDNRIFVLYKGWLMTLKEYKRMIAEQQ